MCFRCGTPTMDLAAARTVPQASRPARRSVRVPLVGLLVAGGIVGAGYALGDWERGLWIALAVEAAVTGWWVLRHRATNRPPGVD
ncbi:MAG TPA: hypothetical protein VMM93_06780 [Vicinamibacterales bacterium]|nr:hypothetical protein [Vicinamibacterales bacterium]